MDMSGVRCNARQGRECCGEHSRRSEAYHEPNGTGEGRLNHKARPDGSRGPETV